METENPKSRSIFRRKRTGFVIGLILGFVPGVIPGILIGFIAGLGLLGEGGPFILMPFFAVLGMCGGSLVGAFGGFLGAFVAEKLARDNLMFLSSILGSIVFIGLLLGLSFLPILANLN